MKPKMLLIAAAIVKKGDLFLIARRKSDSFLEPGKWEFPGGKVELLEHPKEALKREIKEELGIDIMARDVFGVYSHVYEKEGQTIHVILVVYLSIWLSGELKNLECQDSRWIALKEFKDYAFVEGDKPIVDDVIDKFRPRIAG